MEAPTEEMYGKSTVRKEHNVEKYIQWVSTLSLTIRQSLTIIHLALVASEMCEILRKLDLVVV